MRALRLSGLFGSRICFTICLIENEDNIMLTLHYLSSSGTYNSRVMYWRPIYYVRIISISLRLNLQ